MSADDLIRDELADIAQERGLAAAAEVVAEARAESLEREEAEAPLIEKKSLLIRGVIITLLGGCLWGLNGTVAKFLMDNYQVDPLWLVAVRSIGSCWFFLAFAYFEDRRNLATSFTSPLVLFKILGVALFCVLASQVTYLQAISWTNSATATVMQSLCLLPILVISCLSKRRYPKVKELVGISLALVGTFLIATNGNISQLSMPTEGLLWGLACASAAAALNVAPVKLLEKYGSFAVNGIAMLMSGILMCALIRPWEQIPAFDLAGWLWLLAIIVLGTFGAYALYLQGVKMVGPMRASLLGTVEPLMATLASVVWLQAVFSPFELAGFIMILFMVYLTA